MTAHPPSGAPSRAPIIAPILEAYRATVYAKDLDAHIALYDDDVQIFDMWGAWSSRGIAAWRSSTKDWFDSLGTERVVVDIEDLQEYQMQDLATGHAIVSYTAVSAAGMRLRSLSNRFTIIVRRVGVAWTIVHQHTSAPASDTTLTVSLQRPTRDHPHQA
jgi:ketosteroid isomerase-like protein